MNKFLSLLLVSSLTLNGEGFIAGTLVKTSQGYTCIENLQRGDKVESFDFDKGIKVENEIIQIREHNSKSLVYIYIDGESLQLDENQKIYCPLNNDNYWNTNWVKAKDLQENQIILTNKGLSRIQYVTKFNYKTIVYDLSIKNNHNFIVSKNHILTHNFIPIIIWAAGEGVSICWFGVATVAIWAGITYHKNGFKWQVNDNDMRHIFNKPGHNFNGKDPKDILQKIKEMLEKAFRAGRLEEGKVYLESTQISPQEVLYAKGTVVNGIVRIGTAFIKIFGK